MNLKNAQLDVDNWIKDHGVRYFNELTNMAQLTEEVGEVARIIARRYGEQSEKESDKNKDLGEELADVVFVVLCLANQTGIDLQAAFDKKMDLKTNRDHDRHQNNANRVFPKRSYCRYPSRGNSNAFSHSFFCITKRKQRIAYRIFTYERTP